MALVVSYDFGTGGVRAGVFDTQSAQMLASAEAAYGTDHPHPGWAEQDPAEWWQAAVTASRAALEKAGRRDIAAVTVATTASTVVVCRRDGTSLRPAILWMDCRAETEARFTETVDHPVMAYSGHADAVEWLVPKAMWLAANEPDLYRSADVICEAVDFINFRLSGEWAGSQLNAVCKWNYDSEAAAFYPDLYAAFGIGDLRNKLPPRIVPVGEAVGTMLPAVAAELGMEGTPLIAQGGIDAHIGVFGAGTVRPGRMLMIAGTSVVHLTHVDAHQDIGGIWGPYPHALVDGLWLIEGGQVSAGSILSWLTDSIFGLDQPGFLALEEATARIEPGSTGLVTLDYWMGNRTPYRDANLRGAVLGLSLWHDRATLYRSAIDAVALGSANVLEDLATQGVAIDHLVLSGGIGKNRLWLQASVDAIGKPVQVVLDSNLSLRGGAVCAANALGEFAGLEEASDALAAPSTEVEPDPQRTRQYAEMLGLYHEATASVAPLVHQLAKVAADRSRE